MENAADAFKIILGLLLFVVAVSIVFILLAQAIATSDIVITALDESNFYPTYRDVIVPTSDGRNIIWVYDDFSDNIIMKLDEKTRNRIVGVDTIIATIYRYHRESFCVTIKDRSGTIIAQFNRSQETKSPWNLAVGAGRRSREPADKRIDYFLSLSSTDTRTINSVIVGFGDYLEEKSMAEEAMSELLDSTNSAEFIEDFVEVNYSGHYVTVEDGTGLTLIPGGKMVYITYQQI